MTDTAATRKRTDEEDLFEGFTDAERRFIGDLAGFLAEYKGFAGETPFEIALAATFQVKLGVLREGKLPPSPERTDSMCLCWDSVHKKWVYCACK
jgi:hypothetical protein